MPAGRLLWQLTWDQMLCVELAYHSQGRSAAPDGVIVHRKYRQGDEVLVHDVRCTPNTNQVWASADSPPSHGMILVCWAEWCSVAIRLFKGQLLYCKANYCIVKPTTVLYCTVKLPLWAAMLCT